ATSGNRGPSNAVVTEAPVVSRSTGSPGEATSAKLAEPSTGGMGMRWQTGRRAPGMAATLLVLGMGVASAAETPQAKDTKAAPEAWLGVYSQTLTPELREGLNYNNGSGALVSRVVDGSPAEKAGVKSGDVIVGINTTTVASATDLTNAIGAAKVGETISVRIVRDGTRSTLSAKLAEQPQADSEDGA